MQPTGSCGQYEKISSKTVQEKLRIQHRVGDVEVENRPTPYRWTWLDKNDKEYADAQVKHFQLLPDGKEQENRGSYYGGVVGSVSQPDDYSSVLKYNLSPGRRYWRA